MAAATAALRGSSLAACGCSSCCAALRALARQSPLRRRLYAGRPVLLFLQLASAAPPCALWPGNRRFDGRFARVDRFLLNHHVLLAGFARFGAGYCRFNCGFARVNLGIRLDRLRFFSLTGASLGFASFTRRDGFTVVRLLAGGITTGCAAVAFFSRTRASAALMAS